MIKILFVCLGNICRSPMAEAVFRDLIQKEGLEDKFQVDSAGIGHWHIGNPPHQGTRDILDRLSISYQGMKARQVSNTDFLDFDYIIAMDEKNVEDLKEIGESEQVTVARLLDFVPGIVDKNVPDPYFTKNFEYTYELVLQGCQQLLERIKSEHQLS
ncbi:low molecular weight protein-tyrosine-phosphatase [Aquibacillus salsiterrae]|uniref:protein-tyrosine-phosphatase n=1 Tax=Aquibacillus salsiterrae TaxID=2950439 RepID=A0A9X3WIP4_9BACI|nr:low molecular weight protein-tyrosine-phosphatase [Aquibacillus salsiterrae]MDC3418169.1 low molecular weight phosphotyrosine protein phosphatase [Aquibacillus salsiterrae]